MASSSSSSSSSSLSFALLAGVVLLVVGSSSAAAGRVLQVPPPSFEKNYAITWGWDHASPLDQGRQIQLSMDKSTGSGFGSKLVYTSGFFHLNIKLPGRDSAGVVTAFYLSSHTNHHDELDFEFLGNLEGKPYVLQTNVFANGKGNREQKIHLWFDPTASFHHYKILWNPYHIVFLVDNIPIRVFRNKTNIGVDYPSQPMQIIASLWDGEDWATNGGNTKTNWAQAPFKAFFQGFDVDGCPSGRPCSPRTAYWNKKKFSTLDSAQQQMYEHVKEKYMTYDYCSDRARYPIPPPECPL